MHIVCQVGLASLLVCTTRNLSLRAGENCVQLQCNIIPDQSGMLLAEVALNE